jgi:hypothetical protein
MLETHGRVGETSAWAAGVPVLPTPRHLGDWVPSFRCRTSYRTLAKAGVQIETSRVTV